MIKCDICGIEVGNILNELRICAACGCKFCHGCASLDIDLCDYCVEHAHNSQSELYDN